MLRSVVGTAGVGVAAFFFAAAAQAKEYNYYFSCSTQVTRGAVTTVYSSGIFRAPYEMYSPRDYAKAFKAFLISQGIDAPYSNCSASDTTKKAFRGLDYSENHALKMKARFQIVPWAPPSGRVIARGEQGPEPQAKPARTAESKSTRPTTRPDREAEVPRGKTRAEYEAEFQAKLAAHEAKVAEYERKVAARQAEIARQQREHDAAQSEAQKAVAAHEAKMEAHRRRLAEAERAREEWLAVKRRHDRCMAGDRQACEDMAAGKPATPDKLADAGEASTNNDATICVSRPVVSGNATFEGNTAAMVVNGCETAVDVRICLMREGGWNCGVKWGLQPQDRFSHSSFKASGEIFWDARVSGSNRPLSSPGSN